MKKRDVLVVYPARPKAMAQLEESYTLHRYDEADDKQAFLAEYGPRCEAIVTNGHAALTRAHLDHLPNLKIVCCSSAGFEPIDVDALQERGIWLTNSSVALCDDVADMALLLTLATRRQLVAAHEYVRSGDWGRKGMYPLLSSMSGKRVGIAGIGTIGQAIARRFEPLGLEIGYTARSARDLPWSYFPDVQALAEWADILVAIVPGGAATQGMFNKPVLEALGPTGSFINVARGSVVDEPALIEALSTGKLGSAALDVYLNEPNPNPALTQLPNVTLYPHHASGTVETRDAMAQTVVDNLAAFFAGKPLFTPVFDLPETAVSL
ncbi:2-hydroxyacid dehydrogenase [Salipiger sp. PrR002]|uniref:2-hydroxyacid dehydrogenase n=1 Tax=Salipiger sp. PrR002 TaxID=2706489 RepID=UPI0013B992B4|nr:2-hydroxyacid dehydrogenase [Salipiger sp. PrR002]NDW00844.1 2-hydroxyacid dehydrogenase [Salipiger sp. PrR002]NDW58035.1 2-hydroxyacid dehydrogenase [Salipiger sp. PrR004]